MQQKILHFDHEVLSMHVPYYEYIGSQEGKHIIISGGMHGDEINGILIVRKLQKWLEENIDTKNLVGKITVLPIINPIGFQQMKRRIDIDDLDLNRCFGVENSTKRSFSIAYAQFLEEKFFAHVDYGIDIHDAGGNSVLVPHPRIHLNEPHDSTHSTHEMAKFFDSKIVMERLGHENMLAVHMKNTYQTPILTLEIGGGQMVFSSFQHEAIRGIKNILKAYDFIPGEPELTQEKQFFLTERDYYKAKEGGYFHCNNKKVGETILKGEKVGGIYYPYSDTYEDIISPEAGFIFSLRHGDQIPAGANIFSVLGEEIEH